MKMIQNNLVYDTTKAEEIARNSYLSPGDFHYYCDRLYRTASGRFFMVGEGGAMSKYAEAIGNNTTSGSSRIWAISKEEAKKFCEKYNTQKAIEIWKEEYEEA